MSTDVNSLRRLRRVFFLLSALRWLPVGLVAPVLVLNLNEAVGDLSVVGIVLAAYGLGVVVFELPTGGLADSIGARPVLLAGAALETAFLVALLVSDSPFVLTAAAFVGGCGRALTSGPLEAWFVSRSRSLDSGFDPSSGLARCGAIEAGALAVGSLSTAALPQILDTTARDNGYFTTQSLPVAAAAFSSVVYLVAIRVAMPSTPTARDGHGPRHGVRQSFAVLRSASTHVRRSRNLRLLLGAGAAGAIALSASEILWQPQFEPLTEGTNTTTVFGLVTTSIFAAALAGSVIAELVGPTAHRRLRPTLFLARVAQGVCLIAAGLASDLLVAAVFFAGIYFLNGLLSPLVKTSLHANATDHIRTTIVSADSLSMQLGGLLSALVLTRAAEVWSISAAWSIAAGVSAAGASAFLFLEPAKD